MSDRDCTECCGSGIAREPDYYVPGEQFVEPPSEDMCGACLGTGSRAAQEIRADRDRLRARVAELEAAGGVGQQWECIHPELDGPCSGCSPRSWSLPAPPPDDVTAQDELRRMSGWFGGAARKMLLDRADELDRIGTAVEGEPPRFERGFYRLARDLDTEAGWISERLVFVACKGTDDDVWRVFVESGDVWVSVAALAAAGAVRVEERDV